MSVFHHYSFASDDDGRVDRRRGRLAVLPRRGRRLGGAAEQAALAAVTAC